MKKKYYKIPASVVHLGGIVLLILSVFILFEVRTSLERAELKEKIYHSEFGSLDTKLQNNDECYLCGYSNKSLMGYYRKFDTIGIIGLNEWYILDLRLKSYDGQGNETEAESGTSSVFGNSQGVHYHLDAIPSRGKASAKVSADADFDSELIQNHLCQGCLDKVTETLSTYRREGEKEKYNPFVLVDFDTLEVYSMQKPYAGYFIRDYWVEIQYEEEIEIDAYYLPER